MNTQKSYNQNPVFVGYEIVIGCFCVQVQAHTWNVLLS